MQVFGMLVISSQKFLELIFFLKIDYRKLADSKNY